MKKTKSPQNNIKASPEEKAKWQERASQNARSLAKNGEENAKAGKFPKWLLFFFDTSFLSNNPITFLCSGVAS